MNEPGDGRIAIPFILAALLLFFAGAVVAHHKGVFEQIERRADAQAPVDAGSGPLFLGVDVPHRLLIGSGPVAVIEPSGQVILHGSPNEAARVFWAAVAESNPMRSRVRQLEDEITQLRADLEGCRRSPPARGPVIRR